MIHTRNLFMASSAIALACTMPFHATAQSEPAAAQSFGIEEIMVTAEKRSASLQDTSIAISAFDQSALDRAGVSDIEGLTVKVPSLHLSSPQGVVWLSMRGVGNVNTTAGGDNGVAFHYDGVYMGFATAALVNMWDVERVEILRGPQGTLYGRNATGGTINVIAAKPEDEFSGKADLTLGNYNLFQARGVLNIPMGPVRSRFSFVGTHRDGYQENLLANQPDADDQEEWMARAQFAFDPADNIDVLLSFVGARNNDLSNAPVRVGDRYPAMMFDLSAAGPTSPPFSDRYTAEGVLPKPTDPRQVRKDHLDQTQNHTYGVTGTVNWDIDNVTWKTIAAYYDVRRSNSSDWDASEADIMILNDRDDVEQFSLETQLLSNDGGDFEWIIGASYFDMDDRRVNEIQTLFDPVGWGFDADFNAKSYAIFGQATYHVTDQVRVTAGGRFSHDKKEFYTVKNDVGTPKEGGLKDSWSEPTGRLSIDWSPTDDNMVYASVSRGYKAGGMNLNSTGEEPAVDPETVLSFEVGSKNMLFDRRLRLNLTAFWSDYKDLQLSRWSPNNPAPIIENAAKATIWGLEAEASVYVTDNFRLDGTAGYINAEFDDFNSLDPSNPGAGLQDLAGLKLINTPSWTLNMAADYSIPTDYGTWSLRGDWSYRSRVYFTSFNVDQHSQSGYHKLDARVIYESADQDWSIEGYVQNITNKDVLSTLLVLPAPFGSDVPLGLYAPPRTYGLRIGVSF